MRAIPVRLDLTAVPPLEVRPRAAAPFTPPRPRHRHRDQQSGPRPVWRARPLPKPGGVR